MLADWAAIAIDNARLYRGVRERRDELERAVRGARDDDGDRAGARRRDRARARPGADRQARRARWSTRARWSIALRDGDELVVAAARRRGAPRGVIGRRIPIAESLPRRRPAQRPRRSASDVDEPPRLRFALLAEPRRAHRRCSSRCVFRGEAVGVLAAFDRTRRRARVQRRGRAADAGVRGQRRDRGRDRAQTSRPSGLRRSLEAAERERRAGRASCTTRPCRSSPACACCCPARAAAATPSRLERARRAGASSSVTHAIDDLRALITELRPAALDELGAAPALEALDRAHAAADRARRSTIEVDLAYEHGRAAAPRAGARDRRSTGSCRRRSRTSSSTPTPTRVEVAIVEARRTRSQLVVRDDGAGFDPDADPRASASSACASASSWWAGR